MTSKTVPAQLHATGVAVFPALLLCSSNPTKLLVWVMACVCVYVYVSMYKVKNQPHTLYLCLFIISNGGKKKNGTNAFFAYKSSKS